MFATLKKAIANYLRPEQINGAGRCPTYLFRWCLLSTRWFKVYLHKFVADDWSLDLHDHPKRFISIGLWGSYREITPRGAKVFRAPWYRSFPAEHVHRIELRSKLCWTLVIVGRASRPWGFIHLNEWILWRKYVGSEVADQMKSCTEVTPGQPARNGHEPLIAEAGRWPGTLTYGNSTLKEVRHFSFIAEARGRGCNRRRDQGHCCRDPRR